MSMTMLFVGLPWIQPVCRILAKVCYQEATMVHIIHYLSRPLCKLYIDAIYEKKLHVI